MLMMLSSELLHDHPRRLGEKVLCQCARGGPDGREDFEVLCAFPLDVLCLRELCLGSKRGAVADEFLHNVLQPKLSISENGGARKLPRRNGPPS